MSERRAVTADSVGATLAAPAPRLSDTPALLAPTKPSDGHAVIELLTARGISTADIEAYRAAGALQLDS